jgi:medium-chain acyl-[acyl-carrier-protein] hydrolase
LIEALPSPIQEETEIWSIALPGHLPGRDETPLRQLRPLVESLYERLLDFLEPPYAFFGHSLGALLGFELARQLERDEGIGPMHMIVSGFRAPHLPPRTAPMHGLSDAQLSRKLRTLGGTPQEVLANDELLTLLLPILRADFAVCESYAFEPSAPVGCSITALCGTQDALVPVPDVAAWGERTSGAFSWFEFPGGHFFLDESRDAVREVLAVDLAKLLSRMSLRWK